MFCLCNFSFPKSFKDWVNLVQFQPKCSNSKGFYWQFPFFSTLTWGTKYLRSSLQILRPGTETQFSEIKKWDLRFLIRAYCKGVLQDSFRERLEWLRGEHLILTHVPGLTSDMPHHPPPAWWSRLWADPAALPLCPSLVFERSHPSQLHRAITLWHTLLQRRSWLFPCL